jgi:hypothetical protein
MYGKSPNDDYDSKVSEIVRWARNMKSNKKLFDYFDSDASGSLDAKELLHGLDDLAVRITKKSIENCAVDALPWPYRKVSKKLAEMSRKDLTLNLKEFTE